MKDGGANITHNTLDKDSSNYYNVVMVEQDRAGNSEQQPAAEVRPAWRKIIDSLKGREEERRERIRKGVEMVLSSLTARERLVLQQRLGLGEDGQPKTLVEVGKMINRSPSTVRRTEERAFQKLRPGYEANK